jgi:uncharacterized protein GlcG (DUF336 family)
MSISIDLARRILEACKQRARELRSPVSIAIVDAGGHLVLFERMMSPHGWATGDISIAKANTSVMFNQSTDSVAQWASAIPGFAASLATMTGGQFIMAAGGWPIRVNGITVGGLGVSGGNAAGRDEEIASAGLAVLGTTAPPAFQGQPAQPQPAQYPSQWAQPPMRAAQPMPYQGTASLPVPPQQPVGPMPIINAVASNEALGTQQTTSTIHLPDDDPYEAFSNKDSTMPNTGRSGDYT